MEHTGQDGGSWSGKQVAKQGQINNPPKTRLLYLYAPSNHRILTFAPWRLAILKFLLFCHTLKNFAH